MKGVSISTKIRRSGNVCKKMFGYVETIEKEAPLQKGLLDFYDPPSHASETYSNWVSQQDLKTCPLCVSLHGKIYGPEYIIEEPPPIHQICGAKFATWLRYTPGTVQKMTGWGRLVAQTLWQATSVLYHRGRSKTVRFEMGQITRQVRSRQNDNNGSIRKRRSTFASSSLPYLVRSRHQLL